MFRYNTYFTYYIAGIGFVDIRKDHHLPTRVNPIRLSIMKCSHYKQKQVQNNIWQCRRLTICCMVFWLVNFSSLDTEFFDLCPNLALKLLVVPHTNITLTSTNYCQVVSSKPGARWNKAWSWDGGAGIKRCNSTSSGSHSISWSMKGWYKPVGVDIEVELKVLTDKFIIKPAVFVVPLQYT